MRTLRVAKRIGNKDQGILIRDILKTNKTTVVSRKRFIQFDKKDMDAYKRKLNELVNDEILNVNCKYEDNVWYGLDTTWNQYFNFTHFEYNSKIYNALKCYVITELYDRRISIRTVGLRLSEVKKTIKMTKGYNLDYMESFINYIESKSDKSLSDFKFGNTSFLYFCPINDCDSYLMELSWIKSTHRLGESVRKLPPYKNVVWFDYIISDFMNMASEEMKKRYFPLFLWWRITTVIPMRPNEFLRFKINCSYLNEKDNGYYLKVPRSKQPPNPLSKRRVIPIVDELKTNEEIYRIINHYIRLLGIENEKYLLPLKSFIKCFSKSNYDYVYERHLIKDRITYRDFINLLESFYQEVVIKNYHFKVVTNREEINDENEHNTLVKFKLGDTRHLAFCSMMLQGFNPLTIAQMGGHESLYAQNHYLGHLDEFIDAHSMMLTKYIKSNIDKDKEDINDILTSDERRKLTFKQFDDDVEPRNIDSGLCYSKDFPNECIDKNCIFCDHFKIEFDNLNNSDYDELSENLSIIKNEIKIKLGFLKRCYRDISKDGSVDLVNLKCSDKAQGELSKQSKELSILVNREATLTAYMEKIREAGDIKDALR